jgi:hypothetical protein
MFDEFDLLLVQGERDEAIRAAARIANALKDIYNDIGDMPEVKARFDLVATDVGYYSGLEDF